MADIESKSGGNKRAAFTAIAILLPLLLVSALEVTLRAVDAFPREPLFIQNPNFPEYSLANPKVVQRFFSHPGAAPNVSIETAFFRTQKPEQSFRLVVQGGSSAAGFPFGYGASLGGMLEQRLRREFPARHVEVVSTAMSAVNTYTLLDFADEIAAIEPDAVLIYAGHNEFLGILGVGSALSSSTSPAVTRLIMSLRRLQLYRGIERLLAPEPRESASGGQEGREEGTLMARIAAERRIPLDSRLFERGEEQFRTNLSDLLHHYRQAGIPVLVATLVSNEADQAPFIDGLEDAYAEFLRSASVGAGPGSSASETGMDQVALLELAQAGSANAAYALGQARILAGDSAGGLKALILARDLDQLRFRAPSSFDEIIREVSAGNGALLVDVQLAFRSAAPSGVIGRELITEHLHPNVEGYFILADAFHKALLENGLLPTGGAPAATDVARREIPVSSVDRRFGEYKLARLMSDWPFTDQPSEPILPPPRTTGERLGRALYDQEIDWATAQRRLLESYSATRDADEYLRLSLILADAFPFSAPDQLRAGQALLRTGRNLQAVRYLLLADQYRPRNRNTLVTLGQAALSAGLPDLAVQTLEKASRLFPRDTEIQRLLAAARP